MKRLGFGLMRLPLLDAKRPESVDLEQTKRMVDTFLERGFTYFDTAYLYHGGTSERAAGEVLVKRHPRDSFTLTTKLPVGFLEQPEDMERIFSEQLERCGVEYFDYYLLHNLNAEHYAVAQDLGCFDFILRKKAEGKIRNVGFSYHDDAALLERILREHPETETVQLQINYLDWEDAGVQSRLCYETARAHGKDVIVMEPVKGGMLAEVPPDVERMFRKHAPEASAASWAVRFAAGLEGVTMVLSGMSNYEQLLDNTSYMREFRPLSAEEAALVARAVERIRSSIAVPCTGCNYCGGCPKNIPISRYFALYNGEQTRAEGRFPIQKAYYENAVLQGYGKASDCIGCRQCEPKCPQHIRIADNMKKVARAFE